MSEPAKSLPTVTSEVLGPVTRIRFQIRIIITSIDFLPVMSKDMKSNRIWQMSELDLQIVAVHEPAVGEFDSK